MNQKNRMESSEANLRLYVNLPYAKSTTNQQGGSIILKVVSEQHRPAIWRNIKLGLLLTPKPNQFQID